MRVDLPEDDWDFLLNVLMLTSLNIECEKCLEDISRLSDDICNQTGIDIQDAIKKVGSKKC